METQTSDESDPEWYTENSPFITMMGDSPRTRLIDVLVRYSYDRLSIQELEDISGLDGDQMKNELDDLIELDIAVEREGEYSLCTDSDIIPSIKEFHRKTAKLTENFD